MICITSDIHHMSLNTGNQQHCDITEVETALLFLKLLDKYDLKATFFISGKTFAEEWEALKPICESPGLEIGGHTYDCFEPELWHRVWNKINGSYNGPAWYQKRDVKRTIDIIQKKTGRKITSWRNHMYMHGPFTEKVLSDAGILICSDGVKKNALQPQKHETGIYNFPINIIPDHEHLYHAERTPEWVEAWVKRYNWSDDFGSASYDINTWAELVLNGLKDNLKKGVVSNIIIHPITMYLCDRFEAIEKVLSFISEHQTLFISETVPSNNRSAA